MFQLLMPGSVTAPSVEFPHTPNAGSTKHFVLNHCSTLWIPVPEFGLQMRSGCARLDAPDNPVPVRSWSVTGSGLPVAAVYSALSTQLLTAAAATRGKSSRG